MLHLSAFIMPSASLTNITYFMAALNSCKLLVLWGLQCKRKSLKSSLPGSNILALLRAVRYQLPLPTQTPDCVFPLMELNGKIYLQTLGKVLADHA